MRKASLILVAFVCTLAHAQLVVPFMGVGNIQEFDNNGAPCFNCVLYTYQAGTTTQQATFTDATGTIQNVNPLPFGGGARVGIWLSPNIYMKFVLCLQNDGPTCAPSDVLFSVDQVPTSQAGSGGGGSGPPFITGSANPATTGVLRLASGDSICWRNVANSANLCVSKDTNDVLAWLGGTFKLPLTTCGSGAAGWDAICASSSTARMMLLNNGGPIAQIVLAGVDINNSDQVTQLHFGATPTPLSGTAPTTGQTICWNGSSIAGCAAPENVMVWSSGILLANGSTTLVCGGAGGIVECASTVFANAHTLIRFTYNSAISAVGCSTNLVIGVRDVTASTTIYSTSLTNGQALGFVDSGPIAVSIPAGHQIGIGAITSNNGCSTIPEAVGLTMVYQ